MSMNADAWITLAQWAGGALFAVVSFAVWCSWRVGAFFSDIRGELRAIREEISAERRERRERDQQIEERVRRISERTQPIRPIPRV
jgi:hypothetical protein